MYHVPTGARMLSHAAGRKMTELGRRGEGSVRKLTEACGIADVSAGIPYVRISTVKERHFFLYGHNCCPEIS